ncbi:lysozyme inhibitor LprI family protein [Thalassotalea sp. Y01]|uniref:lysozyme inhibitor LprI family protein n=1 Tax=Thalassotalea sp. Y01 TaxID=2729613 RepID=UPI00145DD18A|nr:lysozyme inhibitor LprI family protein [Thalassotalea sp. Y01]NMP17517.1 DUF1311 domain-containing protein [Thalassotalea sp. Y01]
MNRLFTAIVLFIASTASVNADTNLSQLELNQASSQHLNSAQFMLRKAYEQLSNELDATRKQQLKESQELWEKYAKANAELVADAYKGGSIRNLIYAQSLIELTEQRTALLTKMHLKEITP